MVHRIFIVSILLLGLLLLLLPSKYKYERQGQTFLLPKDEQESIRKLAAEDAPHVLNVHVVAHTHDDVGWRKTVEQYYYGYNNSIDTRGSVNSILSTVVSSLLENSARTFTYVEQKFFSMWWKEQNDAVKDSVRYLIANQQLFFVNGGWCMHDEASTHYMGMIDQTTLGHQFLLKELGVIPTVGWQVDPFGHSATQASLLTARAGMDALYFGRIDYQDLALRRLTQECEGLWNASSTPVFWGLTGSYGGNYGAPGGFCFDVQCGDEPLIGANTTRLHERIQTFLQEIRVQSDQTKGNHIMVTMGSDFQYMEAHSNFANLDLLIGSIMNFQKWNMVDVPALFGPRFERVNVFYSTPEYYTKMKYQETQHLSSLKEPIQWSVKTDDFFPYSDCPHCFWTGYFTSRTALKRFERVASSFLMAARQIDAYQCAAEDENMTGSCCNPLHGLEDAVSVVQHHDGVSGTAMQHVANDYSFRLQAGMDIAVAHVIKKIKDIMITKETEEPFLENLSYCQLINETSCPGSENADLANQSVLYVIVYNPLSHNRSSVVSLPVSEEGAYLVERVKTGIKLPVDTISVANHIMQNVQKNVLSFATGVLPPLGAVVFKISKENNSSNPCVDESSTHASEKKRQLDDTERFHVSNGLIEVDFDPSTGMIKQIASQGVVLPLEQEWGFYTSYDYAFDDHSKQDRQNSGAYIFRPSYPTEDLTPLHPKKGGISYKNSSVGVEVYVSFEEPWVNQTTRVLIGQPYVEIEYTIGPIPISDGRGKEIISRYMTPIKSDSLFYTDSNGREFLQRRKNYRPSWDLDVFEPVAGNYYPVNAAIYLEDASTSFSIVVDRSQGGASLVDGSIELMVQRRTLADDSRGVDEPLNETCGGITAYPPYGSATRIGEGVVVRGKHRVVLGKGNSGAASARSVMDEAFAEPIVFVGSEAKDKPTSFRSVVFSGLRESLSPNLALLTLSRLTDRESETFLIRLGHQYGLTEDEELSRPLSIDLSQILAGYKVTSVTEMTLSGNQKLSDYLLRRLNWTNSISEVQHRSTESSFNITIEPMEIRTFEITVTPSS